LHAHNKFNNTRHLQPQQSNFVSISASSARGALMRRNNSEPSRIDWRIELSIGNHQQAPALLDRAAGIVSAYVSNNSLPATDLPSLLIGVYAALRGLASGASAVVMNKKIEKATPSVIRKSIQPEGLISFIDGKTYKTLKRHLSSHGLSPRSYRERYGLPADYPMVASSYAEQRSALAKAIGLGQPGAMAERGARSRPNVAPPKTSSLTR
jgi:predicted transcriptional regulator